MSSSDEEYVDEDYDDEEVEDPGLNESDLSHDKDEELLELDDELPEIEEFDDDDDDNEVEEQEKEWTEQLSELETKATELAAEGDMSSAAEVLTTLTEKLANGVMEDEGEEDKIAEYKVFVMSVVSLWSEVLEALEDDAKAELADNLRRWFNIFVDNDILARPEGRAHETEKDKQSFVNDFFEQLDNLDVPAKKKARKA